MQTDILDNSKTVNIIETSKLDVGMNVFVKWYITILFKTISTAVEPSDSVTNDESMTLNCVKVFEAAKFSSFGFKIIELITSRPKLI